MDDRVDFVTIESDSAKESLACPKCGCTFDIDVYEHKNLVFDKACGVL